MQTFPRRHIKRQPAPATTAVTSDDDPRGVGREVETRGGLDTRFLAAGKGRQSEMPTPSAGSPASLSRHLRRPPALSRVNLGILHRGGRRVGDGDDELESEAPGRKNDPGHQKMGVDGGYRSPRRPPDAAKATTSSSNPSFTSCGGVLCVTSSCIPHQRPQQPSPKHHLGTYLAGHKIQTPQQQLPHTPAIHPSIPIISIPNPRPHGPWHGPSSPPTPATLPNQESLSPRHVAPALPPTTALTHN